MKKLALSLIFLPMFLGACATTGTAPAVTPATVVQEGQTIANALALALPSVAQLPAVAKDPKAVAAVNVAIANVGKAQASLSALAANLPSAQQGAVTLTTVFSYLNAAVAAAQAIPGLPPNVQTGITTAAIGLPILEAFINTTLGTQLSATKPAAP